MLVASNSSPLINLSIIGRLELLQHKFSEVLIPQAVWREVVIEGIGKPGAEEVEKSGWTKVKEVQDKLLVASLTQHLDDGESEAIALALEMGADLVLLDEKDARETAEAFGLNVLGIVGILVWAKREGLILSLKAELDKLVQTAQFRISKELYRRALAEGRGSGL